MDFVPFINKVDFSEIAEEKFNRENPTGMVIFNPHAMSFLGQFEARQFWKKRADKAVASLTSDWQKPYHQIGRASND